MITLDDVSYAYPRPEPREARLALQNINLEICSGERVVITGKNGSGKSTLLRLIASLILPTKGVINYSSPDIISSTGLLQQSPENQLITSSVENEIAFGLENKGIPSSQIQDLVKATLHQTNLEGLRFKTPNRMSGGEMQRVAFASLLALSPRLWLMDEPAAFLDPFEKERIYSLLNELPGDSTVIYVVSHPEEFILGDRLIALEDGKVVIDSGIENLKATNKLEEFGLEKPASWVIESLKKKGILKSGGGATVAQTIYKNKGQIEKSIQSNIQPSLDRSLYSEIKAERSFSNTIDLKETSHGKHAGKDKITLTCSNIWVWQRELLGEEYEVVKNAYFSTKSGIITALLGPNGAGKTSLLETIAGLSDQWHGKVEWSGFASKHRRIYSGKDRYGLFPEFGRLGIAFQFPERSFFADTILKEVSFGLKNLGISRAEAEATAKEALELFGLDPEEFSPKSPFEISGGEARRVALATVWALRPDVYLLDEPVAGLDSEGAELVGEILSLEAGRGCAIFITGHEIDFAAEWADRWILLKDGSVSREGIPIEWWEEDEDPWYPPSSIKLWRETGRDPGKIPGLKFNKVLSEVLDSLNLKKDNSV